MNFHNTAGAYQDDRYNLILRLEEGGNPHLTPYNDGAGWVTIGVGFNLSDANVRNHVFAGMGITDTNLINELTVYLRKKYDGFEYPKKDNTTIQNELNTIMAKYPACSAAFEFASVDQAKTVFNGPNGNDGLVQTYENRLNNWAISNHIPAIPESKERLALLSLCYNGLGALPASLASAMKSGDRVEAWFAIRYEANYVGLHAIQNGVLNLNSKEMGYYSQGIDRGWARRRYDEANLFGLYDPTAPDKLTEAKDIYRMLALHRDEMDAYEKVYGIAFDGSSGTRGNNLGNINAIRQALDPAKSALLADLNINLNAADYLSTDIYLDPGRNSASMAIDPNHASILTGSDRNDIFIGAGGNDNLNGGLGNDAYLYQAGDGEDHITDSNGLNAIYVGATKLTGAIEQGTPGLGNHTIWKVNGGEYVYILNPDNNTLTIRGSALGGATDKIILEGITSLQVAKDRYGIDLPFTEAVALTTSSLNPYSDPNYTAADGSGNIGENGSKRINIALNEAIKPGDVVTLVIAGISGVAQNLIKLVTGDQVLDFGSGSITLNPVAGQNFLSFAILEQGNLDANANVTFKAIIASTDANGVVTTTTSNLYTLNIADSGYAAIDNIVTSNAINGDMNPILNSQGNPILDNWGNIISDGQVSPGRADTIYDTSGNDLISAGDGNDTVYKNLSGDDVVNLGAGDDNFYTSLGAIGRVIANGGDGRDYLGAGSGRDIIEGGAGADGLYGSSEGDLLYGDTKIDIVAAIANGETQAGTGQQGEWVDAEDGNDQVITGGGNDLIAGGGGDDLIVTGGGNDVIYGDWNSWTKSALWKDWTVTEKMTTNANGDQVYNYEILNVFTEDNLGSGNDTIRAGAGDDVAFGERGDDTIYLGDGNDKSWGGEGNDIILGGAGDDIIHGDNGFEFVPEALHGNDFLDGGDGNDKLYGGAGNDTIYGGAGNDTLVADSTNQVTAGNNYLNGEDGNDILQGGLGADTLLGGAGDDEINARGANSYLDGGDGNDTLYAERGNNTLFGGLGNDTLQAKDGNNYLDGEEGTNKLIAEGGNNTLFAGAGNDVLSAAGGGNYLEGGDGTNKLIASGGNNELFAGMGDDILSAGEGNNYLDAGEGNNELVADGGSNTLFSGAGNDNLSAAGGGNYLDAGAGNDTLVADGGNNTLLGGVGDDTMAGKGGNNYLEGGVGNNSLYADGGYNTLIAGTGNDTLQASGGFNYLDAGDGINTLIAGGGNNQLFAGAGNDTIVADNGGNNTLFGGGGDDSLSAAGGGNYLDGGDGIDTLIADGGNNTLLGGAGDDVLIAHGGNNTLDGGAGADLYVFDAGFGTDHIADSGGGAGGNTVQFNFSFASSGVVLGIGSLKLSFANGDVLHIDGFDPEDPVNSCAITTFKFSDRTLSLQEVLDIGAPDLIGTTNDDVLIGTGLNERIYAMDGNDTVLAGAGNDTIDGGMGDDVINAGSGNDMLIGGSGADTLIGGRGDDSYVVDNSNDIIIENANEGIDSVRSRASYILSADVENLTLEEGAALDGTGNALDNVIQGNEQANVLLGNAGNDTLDARGGDDVLDGGAGADIMTGGAGGDTYVVDNAGDQVIENVVGQTYNTWWGYQYTVADIDTVNASISYTLGNNVENLNLTGFASIDGTGNSLDNVITGNDGANTLAGDTGNDTLDGGAGNDTLSGGDGQDILIGGAGADVMLGGAGNDVYFVDNAGDQVIESSAGLTWSGYQWTWTPQGVQYLPYSYTIADYEIVNASINYTLGANLEALTLTGTDNLSGTGNELNNTITGNSGDNVLSGGAGSDTLIGGAGNDMLIGGAGDDSYNVTEVGDVIVEDVGGGFDQVYSSADITLSANIERLTLNDGATVGIGNDSDNYLFGNNAHNVLDGAAGNDSIDGGAGDDTISGGDGNDTIRGGADDFVHHYGSALFSNADTIDAGAGDDYVDGGSGSDTILGGSGNDHLYGGRDDGSEGGDTLTNDDTINGGDGNDYIDGQSGADRLYGGAGDDVIYGGDNSWSSRYYDSVSGTFIAMSNDDTIDGGDGNDQIFGQAGNDILQGGAGNDVIDGGTGNDRLDGGTGIDSLAGGQGDDVYVVDGNYARVAGAPTMNECGDLIPTEKLQWTTDTVIENAGEGYDVVISSGSYALTDNVEELRLTFDPTMAMTDPQRYADMIAFGQDGTGNALDNVIIGNELNNRLDGGAGADTLQGGAGNDTYVVDQAGDTIIEQANAGIDTVESSIDYTLAAELENLTLLGGAVSGIGNAANNVISGNAGYNALYGGAGNDTLIANGGGDYLEGGAGNDRYVFRLGDGGVTVSDAQGADTVFIGNDLTVANLKASRSGNDLILSVIGTTDSITITNWLAQLEGVNRIEFCDGSALDYAGINTLLNAPPVANADAVTVYEDSGANSIPGALLLANDTDPNVGDILSIVGVDALSAQGNTVVLDATGNVMFDIGNKYQSLAAGQTLVDSFNYTISDDKGATASSVVNVTITGVNDAPVTTADDATALQEDVVITATGNVLANDTDVDQGTVLQVANAGVFAGQYGQLTLNADGSYTYALDGNSLAVQSLAEGQVVTETFAYDATDGLISTPSTLTVTITGTNDAPVTSVDSAAVQEDISVTVTGNVLTNDTDVDQGTVLSVANAGVFTGQYGQLTLNADGSYTYALDNVSLGVQSLAQGQVVSETFAYDATDGLVSTPSTLTVTITGTNDAPVTTVDTAAVQEDISIAASGNVLLNDSDVDQGTTLSVVDQITWINTPGSSRPTPVFGGPRMGTYGQLNLAANGSYTYTLNNDSLAIQSLAQGQVVTDTFTYQVSDGITSTPSTLTVTITGTNDAPVVVADTNAVQEDLSITASGNVLTNDADVDQGTVLAVANAGVFVGQYGQLTLLADGSYTYALDNSSLGVQSLAEGQVVTETFAYQATDGITSTPSTLTLTITGTNDAPVTTVDTAAVQEDVTLLTTGNVLANDSDVDQGTVLSVVNAGVFAGQFGQLTLSTDGSYTYALDNSSLAVQSLAQGQVVTETFAYQATDGITSTPSTLTLTITGTNDAPVTTVDTAAVQEDVTLLTTGNVLANDSDVDQGTVLSVVNAGVFAGQFGQLTLNADGSYTYVLDNASLGVQSLAQGQVVTETFAYQASDGIAATPSTLTVTITGTNDAPVVVADAAAVQEDLSITATGNVLSNDSDVDQGTVLSVVNAGVFAGQFGQLTLQADGSYTYALDNNALAVQSLAQGQIVTETFSYAATDGITSTPSTLTVTITGTNDVPVTTVDMAAVQEDVILTASGNVLANDTDVDQGTVLSVVNAGVFAGQYGTLTLNADGSYTYALDNASLGVQSLAQGQVVTETFAYQATDGITSTPSTLTVTITGTNDAPVTTVDTAAVQEDLSITATGNVLANDTDVDQGTVLTVANAGVFAGQYGQLSLLADGSYTYALDNASYKVQSLAAGQTVTETFAYQASDGITSTPSTLTVTITGTNDAPVVATAIADQQTLEDMPFSFTVPADTFYDIDQGDVLSYSATMADGSALPGWLKFDAVTRTFSGVPSNWDVAVLNVSVTATDTGGLSATDTFVLDVQNVNDAPVVVNHFADQHVEEDHHFNISVPSNTFDDWDIVHGDSLSLSATLADGEQLPSWLKFDAVTRTFSGHAECSGNWDILLTATDQAGASVSQVFNLSAGHDHHDAHCDTPPVDTTQDEIITSSKVNDIIHTGNGADTIVFKRGDGQDRLYGGIGTDNTVVLAGGIQISDIALSKQGNDLILEAGNNDQINLRGWYDTSANYKSVLNLDIISNAVSSFSGDSQHSGCDYSIDQFDFTAIVTAFDQACGTSATYQHWNAASSLTAAHLASGDDSSLGSSAFHDASISGLLAIGQAANQSLGSAQLNTQSQLNKQVVGV